MKNKKIVEIYIENLEFPNIGIGYFDSFKVKVKNTIPGQIVKIYLSKKKRNFIGKNLNIVKKSNQEIEYLCEDFNKCGGCTYQNIDYEYELKLKEKLILDLFKKNNILNYKFLGIEMSPIYNGYRNKMEFSFGDEQKGGKLSLGLKKRNTYYEVVNCNNCNIIDKDYKNILKFVTNFFRNEDIKFYHKKNKIGQLRHLVVRKSFYNKEIIINLVTTLDFNLNLDNFVKDILKLNLEGKIVGILHTVNNSISDIIKIDKLNILYGRDFYIENLLDLKFKVNAFAFFQTNTLGAEKLYKTVLDFIKNDENIIFDLYCGTGTIAQLVSKKAKKVIGIELSKDSIDSALENIKLNRIKNCEFILGDVLKEIDKIKEKPDIIILDPPRPGINHKAIDKILNFNADNIIYISCNPTTLVIDLKLFLQSGYKIEKIKLHDMFPRTYHIEVVVLLVKT